jgi:hypothetical protein
VPTLGGVSTDADDRSSRLSDALDAIFTNGRDRDSADGADGADVQRTQPEEPYELPEIVPATLETPRLPERVEPVTADADGASNGISNGISNGGTSHADGPAPAPNGPAPMTVPMPVPMTVPMSTPAPAVDEAPVAPATAWGDHMPAAVATTPGVSQLRTPGRRPRVRRVTRVLRHIDPWSTFKVALLFSAVGYVVALTSGLLLWRVADSTGTLDNVERWFTQFGWETFELKGGEIFHNAWIIGLFGVVAATGGAVLLVTLFNLVSDIVGGIRMTVLEEEVVERTISSTRRYVVRTPPAGVAASGRAADWSVDDDTDPADRATARSAPPAPTAASFEPGERDETTEVRTAPVASTRQQPSADWSVD